MLSSAVDRSNALRGEFRQFDTAQHVLGITKIVTEVSTVW
jgi:hypothetical protein